MLTLIGFESAQKFDEFITIITNAELSISEISDNGEEMFETYEEHMRLLLHDCRAQYIGADVSAFARLAAGDQIGHPCWSQYSSIRQCKYGKGHSRIGFSYAGRESKKKGR